MSKVKDLTNLQFGRLSVLYRNGSNKRGRAIWHVKCECGNELDVLGNSLITGNTLSCGCIQKEKARANIKKLHKKQWSDAEFIAYKKGDMRKRFTTHGARSRNDLDPLYSIWRGMKQRCKFIKSYIRKNICVCNEWENSFETFKEWALSNGYERGKHLDRIDNTGNYEPSNCQFLTEHEHRKKTGEELKKYHAKRKVDNKCKTI